MEMQRTRKPLKARLEKITPKRIPDIIVHNEMSDFTIIPNKTMRDPDISWKAKGLLTLILGNKEGWYSYNSSIQKMGKDGELSVRSGLKELEDGGYLLRLRYVEKEMASKKICGSVWICVSTPFTFNAEKIINDLAEYGLAPHSLNKLQQNPHGGKPPLRVTPIEGNPYRGKVSPNNININNINNNNINIKEKTKTKKTDLGLFPDKEEEKERVVSTSDWIIQLYPQEWQDSPSFQESMKDYIQHRKEKGSSITSKSATRLTEKLTQFTITEATQALNTSIENGWQGVFPERISKGFTPKRLGNAHKVPGKKYPTGDVYY